MLDPVDPLRKLLSDVIDALTQPESVAWEQFYPDIGKPQLGQEPSITKEARGTLILHSGWDDLPNGTKLYTTPPKRPWAGLTEVEVQDIHDTYHKRMGPQEFARAIEAKLKEKNNAA